MMLYLELLNRLYITLLIDAYLDSNALLRFPCIELVLALKKECKLGLTYYG
jgi:hypothetical protein